ncbi:hypothetical protein V8E54_002913 [Elaphomyces granulatus]
MTDTLPSAFAGPSSKERKYDRQLRLWAASGQEALEKSHVLLVNSDDSMISGVVGVEALKNLVLPGIGGFTIVDSATVTEPDLGVNFFLDESSLGKSRAGETCRLLRELNPDVAGSFRIEPISELLRDPNFLPQYKLVIISGPTSRSSLDAVCQSTRELGIPVIYTHSVGFYSTFSLQIPSEFPIVETHPDPESTQDLRLLNPWPELKAAGSRLRNLEALDDHHHGHMPYILLLLHYLEKWQEEHDGNYPGNYKDKIAFRDMVRSGTRTNNPEGGEENFDEAVAAVLKSINPWSLRGNVREIFEMEHCKKPRSSSENFWIIASALATFYKKHGVLPLPGSLPDMKAQSADYITLQNIYKAKGREDVDEVLRIVQATETDLGRISKSVTKKEVELFCKNASHVKVIRGRDIPRISKDFPGTLKTIRNNLKSPESAMPIFVAFQALDIIEDDILNGRKSEQSIDDGNTWDTTVDTLIATIAGGDTTFTDDNGREAIIKAAQELRRTEGGELHNISSLTGGMVAQEALKVLTKQYVPLNNTTVFDGIGSRSEMFCL